MMNARGEGGRTMMNARGGGGGGRTMMNARGGGGTHDNERTRGRGDAR